MDGGLARIGNIKSIPTSAGRNFLNWHFWLLDLPLNGIESLEQRLHFHAKLLEIPFGCLGLVY